jgi:hypothetical protein
MFDYLRTCVAAVLFAVSVVSVASASEWLVERTTKQVQYRAAASAWKVVERGMVIQNGVWISTGPRGRVVLTRGSESITFQPGTLASISSSGFFTRKTEIVQQQGRLDLEIEKRARPHTYVHTPYLAAVVKGTIFSVTVTARKASVSVARGLVQVRSYTGGEQTNVGPGQKASVNQEQEMSVGGRLAKPSVSKVTPTSARVVAVVQASATDADEGESVQGSGGNAHARGSRTGSDARSTGSESRGGKGERGGTGNSGGRDATNGGGNGGRDGAGNGNGNGNSGGKDNSGGNGNGNGAGNGNAGGNGQGNGGGNGNSGGNGNGNGRGNGNGNGGAGNK